MVRRVSTRLPPMRRSPLGSPPFSNPFAPLAARAASVAACTFLVICAAAPGCASNYRILNPSVERTPMVFESPQAASVFEDELDERYDSGDADIPQRQGRLSRNAFFNQQIQVADSNNDGVITDIEAWRYAKDE